MDDGFPFDFPLDKAGCHHYGSEAMIDVRIIKSLSGSILSGVNYLHLIVCPRPRLWVSLSLPGLKIVSDWRREE